MRNSKFCVMISMSHPRFPLQQLLLLGVIALSMAATVVSQTANPNQTSSIPSPLRILVPVRDFSYGFVKTNIDAATGNRTFQGLAIDLFRTVMDGIKINTPVNFIPFFIPLNGTFDDMLKAVFAGEFDGAIGDISIVYYRTDWVEFTMPYLESGISMLVPYKQNKGIPLIRVTNGFVAATLVFSFMLALVFWTLEHKNDKNASQPQNANLRVQSVGTKDEDWQREMMRSIIHTRLVVVLLFMLLLVFIACYTASQTSSQIAAQSRRATVRNLDELRSEPKVGYMTGSFIRNLLIQKGLQDSQLKELNSNEEVLDQLSKGPKQGGVSAVVGVTTYLKLLQAQRCGVLTVVPTFNLHSAGFGFAFRRELLSSLVHPLSNGILNVIYNGQSGKIQDRTIGSLDVCQDDTDGSASVHIIDSDTKGILIAGGIGVVLLTVILLSVQFGMTGNSRRRKVVAAYPCYLFPFC